MSNAIQAVVSSAQSVRFLDEMARWADYCADNRRRAATQAAQSASTRDAFRKALGLQVADVAASQSATDKGLSILCTKKGRKPEDAFFDALAELVSNRPNRALLSQLFWALQAMQSHAARAAFNADKSAASTVQRIDDAHKASIAALLAKRRQERTASAVRESLNTREAYAGDQSWEKIFPVASDALSSFEKYNAMLLPWLIVLQEFAGENASIGKLALIYASDGSFAKTICDDWDDLRACLATSKDVHPEDDELEDITYYEDDEELDD